MSRGAGAAGPGLEVGIVSGFRAVLLVLVSTLLATSALARTEVEKEVGVDLAARTARFGWSIAGRDVDVLSELTWDDLTILEIRARGDFVLNRRFFLEAALGGGPILHGENRDSDYAGSGRTKEFSRSENDGGGGEVWEGRVAAGYRFYPHRAGAESRVSVTPLVGFSYLRQDLRLTHGRQTISIPQLSPLPLPPVGPIRGLDSTYDARWEGPFAGVEASLAIGRRQEIAGRLSLHWADFYGQANWNLRDDFAHPKSFEQEASDSGVVVSGRWTFTTLNRSKLSVLVGYESWSTGSGIDRTFLATGAVETGGLNEVHWRALTLGLGATFPF